MQKTEDTVVPVGEVKSTRIHSVWVQTFICQPASGVADTSAAEVSPRSRVTRPPCTG